MLFPCNMDGSESVPECLLFEAEEARVGDALKTGIAIYLDEGLVVQGQQEVGVTQYERTALGQAMDSSGRLTLDGVVVGLRLGIELLDSLPSSLATTQDRGASTLAMFLHPPMQDSNLLQVRLGHAN